MPYRVANPILCAAVGALDSALDKGCRIARPPILTSQYCMAVSIDTCFAVARFFGWFWRVNSQYVTPGFPKNLEYPRVICEVHHPFMHSVHSITPAWANAAPLDDGDILGPCSTTTHHSPIMLPSHGSSAAAFCDEVCHVIIHCLCLTTSSQSQLIDLTRAVMFKSNLSRPCNLRKQRAEITNRPAQPSMAATSVRLNHEGQNMYLHNLTAQHGGVN